MKLTRHHYIDASFILVLTGISFVFLVPIFDVQIDDLFNDDIHLIMGLQNGFGEQGFLNWAFYADHFKLRPVTKTFYLINYLIFGDFIQGYLIVNWLLILGLCIYLFIMIRQVGPNSLAFIAALAIVTSRFMIYPAWNITGSFEILASLFFLRSLQIILSGEKKSIELAIFATLMIFTAERTLPVVASLPFFYLYLRQQKIIPSPAFVARTAGMGVLIMISYLAMRAALELPMIVGTNTDPVMTTFEIGRFLNHMRLGLLETFGTSLGPVYLTGFQLATWVPFEQQSQGDQLIYAASLTLVALGGLVVLVRTLIAPRPSLVFIGLILATVAAASVTFRVELRWLLPGVLILALLAGSSNYMPRAEGYGSPQVDRSGIFGTKPIDYVANTIAYGYFIWFVLVNCWLSSNTRQGYYFSNSFHENTILFDIIERHF